MHSSRLARLVAAAALLPLACAPTESSDSTDTEAARPNAPAVARNAPLRFSISFPESQSGTPLDGRLLLIISNDSSAEPRFQISDGPDTQLIFGIDVDGLEPGENAIIDASVFGYPLESLAAVSPGRYQVQALLNRYETFRRSDGHTVKLPPDRGEGQQWNRKPGNLYSTPGEVFVDPSPGAAGSGVAVRVQCAFRPRLL